MIKNFIFEVCDVLVDFDPDKIIERCTHIPMKFYDFHNLLKEKVLFNNKIILWNAGLVSTEEITRITCNDLIEYGREDLVPYCLDIFNCWYDTLGVDYKMIKLVEKLHLQGYKCYILSNISEQFEVLEPKFYGNFDGAMLSYKEKLLKPSVCIYRRFLDTYNLNPEECFLIDNSVENISFAKSFNIKSYIFKGYSDLVSKLKQMDIFI